MNKISNRQAICDVLVEKAKNDNGIYLDKYEYIVDINE